MIELEQIKEAIANLQREIEELERQQKNNPTAWTPKNGEEIYILYSDGEIGEALYSSDSKTCTKRLKQGSLFPTKKAVEWEREHRKVLHEMKAFAREFVCGETNYSICYNNKDAHINTWSWSFRQFDALYFESEEKAQACIDAIGEERLKKYYFNVKE